MDGHPTHPQGATPQDAVWSEPTTGLPTLPPTAEMSSYRPPASIVPPPTVTHVHHHYAPATYAPPPVVTTSSDGPGLLVRAVWYLFVGWWLSAIVMALAVACVVTVVLLPLGLALVNRLPAVLTLRPSTRVTTLTPDGAGGWRARVTGARQRPFLARAVYFLVVGFWVCVLCMVAAWFLSLTLIGLPLALMILNRLPAATTLRRN